MAIGTRPARRWLTNVAVLVVAATALSGCVGTWGIRSSYRNYVNGPIAHGTTDIHFPAKWVDAAGNGRGPFEWGVQWSEFDTTARTGTIQFRGGVSTRGHATANGWVLDASFWNPRLEIAGDQGTLYADLTFRPFAGTSPDDIQPIRSVLDVPFGTVDLSGQDIVPGPNGWAKIHDAPVVGVPETMELIGWDQFYGHELPDIQLDPISAHFNVDAGERSVHPWADIVVSRTDDVRAGDQIIVWGRGIDPAVNLGGRPPLAGQPSGAYVVFGKFADVWQPSAGAASAARTVLEQRWALPEAQRNVLDPTGEDEAFVSLQPDGSFKAVLTVSESAVAGNYGVYVYPGSGAVNADHELAVAVDVVEQPAPST